MMVMGKPSWDELLRTIYSAHAMESFTNMLTPVDAKHRVIVRQQPAFRVRPSTSSLVFVTTLTWRFL